MACQFIAEEVYLKSYRLDPFFIVGLEGAFSLIFLAAMLPFFIQLKHYGKNVYNEGYLDNLDAAF